MGSIRGDLSVMPLADLVVWLGNREMSGQLRVEQRSCHRSFVLHQGRVIRGATSDPRDYLSQFFLHFQLVPEEQLQKAYATQNETKVRLGRILVMIGLVPEEQVMQMLRIKITETLLAPFRWTQGSFTFVDQVSDWSPPEVEVAIPLLDLVDEGVARDEVWEAYEALFPSPNTRLWVAEDVARHYPAESAKGRILELGRRQLSLDAIALELHASDYQLARHLVELSQMGAVKPREPQARMGFAPDASAIEIEEAQDHLELAQEALTHARYGEAERWLDLGLIENPDDPQLLHLRSQLREITRTGPGTLRALYPVQLREETDLSQLSAKERYILSRIDGQRTVQSIIQLSPMSDAQALEVIQRFVDCGVLSLENEPRR